MFISKLQHIKDIGERNNIFHSLSEEDKRKEIAYDLYLLVKNKNVLPSETDYWSENLNDIGARTPEEFQEILNNSLPENCEVCARGGMMLSRIRLGNQISSHYYNKRGGSNLLHSDETLCFSLDSYIEMEMEYEYSEYEHPYIIDTAEKLMNICLNVINNGDFNKQDRTDYLSTTTL